MAATMAATMGIIGMEIAITGRGTTVHGRVAMETGIGRRRGAKVTKLKD